MRRVDARALRMLGEIAEVKGDGFVCVIAGIAAGNVEQHGIALTQAALGRADRLHGNAGADAARGAVKRGSAQAVLAEARDAEHILGRRLVVARDAHRAAVEHEGADLAAQARFADAVSQQRGRNLLDHRLVQLARAAHAGEFVFAFDCAQRAQHIVRRLRRERQVLAQHGELLQCHGAGCHIDGLRNIGKGFADGAEAAHRLDFREQRLLHRAVKRAAHKQDGLLRGDDERTLLHGAGEIIKVDLIVEQQHGPVGIALGHGAAQSIDTGR